MLTISTITSGNADSPASRRLYETAFPEGEQIPYDDIIYLLLYHPINLPILDEPTNHLDMFSKNELKEVIRTFYDNIIVVSHNRDIPNDILNKVYKFGEHRVREHLVGIYDFLQKKHLDSFQQLEIQNDLATAAPPAEEAETTASQGKMDYQRQKERESIRQAEKKVKILEARIADLEQKFTDSDDPSDNHIPYIVSCELKEGWLSGEKPARNWKKQKSNIILSINPSNR